MLLYKDPAGIARGYSAMRCSLLSRLTEKKVFRESGLFRSVEFEKLEIDLIHADLGILLDDAHIGSEP